MDTTERLCAKCDDIIAKISERRRYDAGTRNLFVVLWGLVLATAIVTILIIAANFS